MNEPPTREGWAGIPSADQDLGEPTSHTSDTDVGGAVPARTSQTSSAVPGQHGQEDITEAIPHEVEEPSAHELRSTQIIAGDTPAQSPAQPQQEHISLGDFELIKKLGEGAMGVVYKARQKSFGRDVALKILFPHIARIPRLVERLNREARALAQLDHPNIVQAYAVGEDQGCQYFAMEYVHGKNLQKWLRKIGRVGVADAVHITLACAHALAYAHRQGMVHRDVKPENILVTREGAVKLADLGMVKTFDDDMALTQTGHAVGTPWYMPLEQARNAKDIDGRSDIYALGCTLYCLVTGNPPFSSGTIVEVIRAKEQGTFPPARAFNPDVPDRLDLIIAKMTAKLPRYRYQTCEEVAADLEALGLASRALTFMTAPPPAPATERGSSSSVEIVKPDLEPEPDPDVWYILRKGPGSHMLVKKYTTARLQQKLTEGTMDPRTKASHSPREGFRALATYREFEGSALSRASKQAADKNTIKYRNLYKKIEERERRREHGDEPRVTGWPAWLGNLVPIGLIALAVVLLAYFVYWVATGLWK
jgi:serine/threonine-protein kinase